MSIFDKIRLFIGLLPYNIIGRHFYSFKYRKYNNKDKFEWISVSSYEDFCEKVNNYE